MLVLTRKIGEEVEIGDGIIIRVVSVQGGRVRLGIVAPPSVPITRSELNAAASEPDTRQPLAACSSP